MSVELYEPITFSVGDRVRVRLSGECNQHIMADDPKVVSRMDGQTGIVSRTDSNARPGHRYEVWIDDPFPAVHVILQCPGFVRCGLFAAAELISLDTDR